MPGFDGTGPRGLGPMTGGGEGICIVRLPDGADSSPTDSTVRVCQPFDRAGEKEPKLARLRGETRRIEAALGAIQARLKQLEATSTQQTGVGR